ncbi:MAG: hypothetical protein NC819_00060 [Candidatus Omnitrophica bacterium]|nr:hypothetical protein [Candidatus Omnitrophota bacterium]
MRETKSLRNIEEKLSQMEPGTLRHEALQAAKRFKSSWIELGRVLWTVYKEKKFREWDYLTFEAYCAKEIGIRAATAKKLLHSYYFLEKEEPTFLKRLEEEPASSVPQAEAVNMLRLLKNKKDLPLDGYRQVREYVLEKGKEAPEVRREIRSLLQAAEPDPEAVRAARRSGSIKRAVTFLRSFRAEMAESKLLPVKLLAEIETLARKLEEAV